MESTMKYSFYPYLNLFSNGTDRGGGGTPVQITKGYPVSPALSRVSFIWYCGPLIGCPISRDLSRLKVLKLSYLLTHYYQKPSNNTHSKFVCVMNCPCKRFALSIFLQTGCHFSWMDVISHYKISLKTFVTRAYPKLA